MKIIKNISFFIIVSTIMTFVATLLDSNFLFVYLQNNIIGLLLTLLAINTATLGLIASKIQDILTQYQSLDFSQTIKEMKLSLLEQIILIIISIFCMIIIKSNKLTFEYKETLGNIILVSVLIYSVNILWDTGKAVFVVIEEIQKMNKSKENK